MIHPKFVCLPVGIIWTILFQFLESPKNWPPILNILTCAMYSSWAKGVKGRNLCWLEHLPVEQSHWPILWMWSKHVCNCKVNCGWVLRPPVRTQAEIYQEMSCLFTVRGCWWYGKNQLKGLPYGCFKICKFFFSQDIEGCAFRRNWRYVSLRRCSRIGCYIFWTWHVTMIVVVILISLVCNAHLEIKESAV